MNERLQTARKKKGMTIQEVALALDMAESTIQEYEKGPRIPRDSIKLAMASIYCVPVQDLFF